MHRLLLVAAAVVAMAAMPAWGQGAPDADQRTVTMEPLRVVHPTPADLAKGEALAYSWTVREPPGGRLYFSTHIHLGDRLVNISEDVLPGSEGKLVADRDGAYSLLWENRSNDTVVLDYSFHAVRSSPGPAPKPAPFPAPEALAGMAAAALATAAVGRRGRGGSS